MLFVGLSINRNKIKWKRREKKGSFDMNIYFLLLFLIISFPCSFKFRAFEMFFDFMS